MLVELKLLKRQDLVSVIANAIKTGGQKDQVSIYHIYIGCYLRLKLYFLFANLLYPYKSTYISFIM